MKKEIVLVLIMLISFPVMADELVESQSLPQAISELASAIKEHTLYEQISKKQPELPPQRFRHFPFAPFPFAPLSDNQKNKPKHQFVTVLKSTIPEVPEGSIFKSNTHGIKFFFDGYWLVLGSVTDSFLNEFGETGKRDYYQWTLSNFIASVTPNRGIIKTNNRASSYRTYSGTSIDVWETDCTSDRYPVNEPMVYPLRLTNDLYVIEFAAPQELAVPKKEN